MDASILSREIFLSLAFVHLLITFAGAQMKLYVPAKIYKSLFAFELFVVTAYIVYTCVTEPFYNGIGLAIFGYVTLYFIIWLSYGSLKHWTINPVKTYSFYPDRVVEKPSGERLLGGYITESGSKFCVYIDDAQYFTTAKRDVPLNVKYRGWVRFSVRVDVIELNQ